MTPIVTPHGGYRKMLSFGFTCLVYHATGKFCERNFNYKNDPLGKAAGQMMGAARSARQNIVEGSVRAGTSKETELRLLDVAKGSLEELAGDYEAFLVDRNEATWRGDDARALQVRAIEYDRFTATEDIRHNFCCHIIEMRKRFAGDLENEDAVHAANAILIAIDRAASLLHRQIERTAEEALGTCGFHERVFKARLEKRDMDAGETPACPKCGGPMRQVVAKKGDNAGRPFWGCRAFPECNGTRPVTPGR